MSNRPIVLGVGRRALNQVSHAFHSAPERQQSVVEQALRRRAAEGGHALPETLGGEATWEQLLLWQERRRRWGTQQVVECGADHWVFLGGVMSSGSVVTVYERVVRIPVGPHHGREHSGDNTPLSDCLIRQD